MECPRCNASLSRYSLAERTVSVCEDCGYVGVDVDHASEPSPEESWSDAIRRFHDRFADESSVDSPTADEDGTDDDATVGGPDEDGARAAPDEGSPAGDASGG